MALRTLGTSTTTVLSAQTFTPGVLSNADLGAINAAITDDLAFTATNPGGILTTGSTHSNTTLDTLSLIAGPTLALGTLKPGMLVLGAGIPAGTFVVRQPTATSVTLSQAATTTAALVRIGFIFINFGGLGGEISFASQQIVIPRRGILRMLPGDVFAIDNTGWPILLSGSTINYAGSQWVLT